MEQKPKIVALVPLRGGSKSIPLKNIKCIAGKPLCLWILESITSAKTIEKTYVSTDSEKIARVIKNSLLPVEVIDRDPLLATDTASTESVMLDFADKVDFDILVTVQATSPLTSPGDFDMALKFFLDNGFDSMLTGVRTKRFFWTDDFKPINYDPHSRPRRQDFKGCIMENGAFYITKKDILLRNKCRLGGKIGIYEMNSETSVELDEPLDWKIVENILIDNKKNKVKNLIKKIELLVMDVDGVLTDASVYCSQEGKEIKRFNVRDGMGIGLIRKLGIKTAIITKEKTDIIDYRSEKLKIDYLYKGIDNKMEIVREISNKLKIPFERIAYIGDDINDLEVLKNVGFSAAPCDAEYPLLNAADYICLSKGGDGCVREVCNIILEFSS